MLGRLSAWSKAAPGRFGAAAGVVLGGAGDLAAQRLEQANVAPAEADVHRTALVSVWYGGAAIAFWRPFFAWQGRRFPTTDLASIAGKVLSFNLALATVDIAGFHLVAIAPRTGLEPALRALVEGYRETVTTGWGLWVPGMALVYRVVPSHLQLAAAYTLDTIWACALSFLSNRRRAREGEVAAPPRSSSSGSVPPDKGAEMPART